MTGFGKSEAPISNSHLSIQLKSLNSKQSDVTLRLPAELKEKEMFFRKQLLKLLGRGKIEMILDFSDPENEGRYQINENRFINYFRQLNSLKEQLGESSSDLIHAISRFPDVLHSKEISLTDQEWEEVEETFHRAVQALIEYRREEGKSLSEDLKQRVENILLFLEDALKFEGERLSIVKNRLLKNLEENRQSDKIDSDRFEQEMIFYLEKYDISEEKQRLKTHCTYFIECMEKEESQGKKLGFISQEIGREINTLGAKANHAEMQKLVVKMKDELEKIKEQILNVW